MEDIRKKVRDLPDTFGVYLLKDSSGRIIYVGKANSLKKRLYSHLRTDLGKKIRDIDHITTSSELSALILEAKLIKQYRPKYNILMRDDKAYPYIKLTDKEDFPRVLIARKVEDDGNQYFGPFRGGSAREIIKLIGRIFLIRRCKDTPLRKRKLNCLNYHMHRCLGPCTARISKKEYRKIALSIIRFFEKGLDATIKELRYDMDKASRAQDYEEAAKLRDKIKWIELAAEKKKAFSGGDVSRADGLEELSRLVGSGKIPKRIEAFDISNLGPAQTVGAMVVFVKGRPFKKHYRKFIISGKGGPDDTAAIHEAVFRRYFGSLSRQLPRPDLILIDGGKGQLSSALKALKEAEMPIKAIGLAKKREELILAGVKDPIGLPQSSPALLLLRQIRDEVHRFAISFHRQRRSKAFIKGL